LGWLFLAFSVSLLLCGALRRDLFSSPQITDVFALIGRSVFGEALPYRFGNLWYSFFTLFQMLTLDDWYTVVEETGNKVCATNWHRKRREGCSRVG